MVPDKNIVQDYSHSHVQVLKYKGEHATISGIGVIHGLASNDELLLLLTLTLGISSLVTIFLGLFIFTLGVVIGMITFSTIMKFSFSKFNRDVIIRVFNVIISITTLFYAFYILFGGEGVNLVPFINEDLEGALLGIAFVLGIKHSMDADHVVAISSILLRSDSITRSTTLSLAWALGHMLTASIITLILYSFREILLKSILSHFEVIVAIMLILIAVLTLAWEFNIIHFGKHSHGHTHVSSDGKVETHNH